MLRDIRSHQRGVRLIECDIDVSAVSGVAAAKDGVIRGFEHVLAFDNTGDVFTFTLVNPGTRPCMAFVMPKAAAMAPYVSGVAVDSVEISDLTDDAYVYILVFDSPDET